MFVAGDRARLDASFTRSVSFGRRDIFSLFSRSVNGSVVPKRCTIF
jgi:hypothetical protein